MVCKLLSMSLNLMLKVSLLLTMFAEVTSSHCGLQCFFLFVLIFLVFMILAEDGRGRDRSLSDLLLLALSCLLPAGILGFKPDILPLPSCLPVLQPTLAALSPGEVFHCSF